jgi:hypothetical protein
MEITNPYALILKEISPVPNFVFDKVSINFGKITGEIFNKWIPYDTWIASMENISKIAHFTKTTRFRDYTTFLEETQSDTKNNVLRIESETHIKQCINITTSLPRLFSNEASLDLRITKSTESTSDNSSFVPRQHYDTINDITQHTWDIRSECDKNSCWQIVFSEVTPCEINTDTINVTGYTICVIGKESIDQLENILKCIIPCKFAFWNLK